MQSNSSNLNSNSLQFNDYFVRLIVGFINDKTVLAHRTLEQSKSYFISVLKEYKSYLESVENGIKLEENLQNRIADNIANLPSLLNINPDHQYISYLINKIVNIVRNNEMAGKDEDAGIFIRSIDQELIKHVAQPQQIPTMKTGKRLLTKAPIIPYKLPKITIEYDKNHYPLLGELLHAINEFVPENDYANALNTLLRAKQFVSDTNASDSSRDKILDIINNYINYITIVYGYKIAFNKNNIGINTLEPKFIENIREAINELEKTLETQPPFVFILIFAGHTCLAKTYDESEIDKTITLEEYKKRYQIAKKSVAYLVTNDNQTELNNAIEHCKNSYHELLDYMLFVAESYNGINTTTVDTQTPYDKQIVILQDMMQLLKEKPNYLEITEELKYAVIIPAFNKLQSSLIARCELYTNQKKFDLAFYDRKELLIQMQFIIVEQCINGNAKDSIKSYNDFANQQTNKLIYLAKSHNINFVNLYDSLPAETKEEELNKAILLFIDVITVLARIPTLSFTSKIDIANLHGVIASLYKSKNFVDEADFHYKSQLSLQQLQLLEHKTLIKNMLGQATTIIAKNEDQIFKDLDTANDQLPELSRSITSTCLQLCQLDLFSDQIFDVKNDLLSVNKLLFNTYFNFAKRLYEENKFVEAKYHLERACKNIIDDGEYEIYVAELIYYTEKTCDKLGGQQAVDLFKVLYNKISSLIHANRHEIKLLLDSRNGVSVEDSDDEDGLDVLVLLDAALERYQLNVNANQSSKDEENPPLESFSMFGSSQKRPASSMESGDDDKPDHSNKSQKTKGPKES